MKFNYNFLILFFITTCQLIGQGGIIKHEKSAYDSYTLFYLSDFNANGIIYTAYLVDNCGYVINEWVDIPRPRHHIRLLENGNLFYLTGDRFTSESHIYEFDWDGELVVDVEINESNFFLDYETIKLENGHYLCGARRTYGPEYFENIGFDPNDDNRETCDIIVEIDTAGTFVWEWNICDHVIQERNPQAPNYGSLKENPQLLNVDAIADFDWGTETFMINGFDYNSDLDQIALSLRKLGEVGIIDHSTTTLEAQGHTGGVHDKGGDFLYRWGNPQNYHRGTQEDRTLYFQHNPNWIKYGEHKGKLIVFNNNLNNPYFSFNDRYSSVEIFDSEVAADGSYAIDSVAAFSPLISDYSINNELTRVDFYSGYISGTQVLPNGHVLISVGGGPILEVDSFGAVVWEYDVLIPFRSEKYGLDYPAFEGKDLTSGRELFVSGVECKLFTSTAESEVDEHIDVVFPNPSNGQFQIKASFQSENYDFSVRDLNGNRIEFERTRTQLMLQNASSQLYILEITDRNNQRKYFQKLLVSI